MARKVLESCESYLITYEPSGGDTVVVTFDPFGAGFQEKGFGSDFCVSKGWSNIHVSQKPGTQYQELSAYDFRSALIGVVENYDNVVAYGASLGGYCALYYGGVINAKILAFSPRNSAHPVIAKGPFSKIKFKHNEIKELPLSCFNPVVLLDPYQDKDLVFYNSCVRPAYPDANVVEVPFGGHRLAEALKEAGCLSSFVCGYVRDGCVQKFKIRKEDGYIWNTEYAGHLINLGQYDLAKKHIVRSLEIKPTLKASNLAISLSQIINERIDFSPPPLFKRGVFNSKSYNGGLYDSLVKVAQGFEQVGEYETAKSIYRQAAINFPSNGFIKEKIDWLDSVLLIDKRESS